MKFLILVNGAPYHRPFFRRVGDALKRMGHAVVYAVDSRYTEYLHPEDPLDGPVYMFSDYLERNFDRRTLPSGYEDCNVWRALFSDIDRAAFSKSHYRTRPGFYTSVAVNLLHFFHEIFEREGIDCLTYECVSNSFVHFAYDVAVKHGARFIGYQSSKIPGRTDISDDRYMQYRKTPRYYEEILSDRFKLPESTREFVRKYIADFEASVPDYMVQLEHLTKNPLEAYMDSSRAGRVWRSMNYLLAERDHHEYAYQIGNPILAFPQQVARQWYYSKKTEYLEKRYFQEPDFGENYFLYPIQFHPESSTSVNAMYFNGEFDNIRNISVSLPYGVTLYVRDHPHASGRQTIELYEEAGKLPNVKLIGTRVPGKTLVKHAKAVVTCSGSMGYEAIVLGVPSFVLGHTSYGYHPACRRITSWEQAFERFSEYREMKSTPAERAAFVSTYYATAIQGVYDLARTHADAAFASRVARLLVSEAERRDVPPMSHDEPE
jgi:hypothetical protein